MTTKELNAQVRKLRKLKVQAEELSKQIGAIEDQIKADMTEANTEELVGKDWRITWHTVFSTRLDTAKLKKLQPNVYNAFAKETASRRFCLL